MQFQASPRLVVLLSPAKAHNTIREAFHCFQVLQKCPLALVECAVLTVLLFRYIKSDSAFEPNKVAMVTHCIPTAPLSWRITLSLLENDSRLECLHIWVPCWQFCDTTPELLASVNTEIHHFTAVSSNQIASGMHVVQADELARLHRYTCTDRQADRRTDGQMGKGEVNR